MDEPAKINFFLSEDVIGGNVFLENFVWKMFNTSNPKIPKTNCEVVTSAVVKPSL